jgi:hypothetical protein
MSMRALAIFQSIASNYPVGNLLLWRTQTKLAAERGLGDFLLPRTDDLSPTDSVLDGQQRPTVFIRVSVRSSPTLVFRLFTTCHLNGLFREAIIVKTASHSHSLRHD